MIEALLTLFITPLVIFGMALVVLAGIFFWSILAVVICAIVMKILGIDLKYL